MTSESAHVIECSNSLLRSESISQQVVGIGLDNIVAIAMPDAVLVARRERSQDVKRAVEFLKRKKSRRQKVSLKDRRPWGWFERLALGDCFQVKHASV